MYGLKTLIDLSNGVNSSSNYSDIEMGVYVRSDSEITDISQIQNVMAPTGNGDGENINSLIEHLKKTKSLEISVTSTSSILLLTKG